MSTYNGIKKTIYMWQDEVNNKFYHCYFKTSSDQVVMDNGVNDVRLSNMFNSSLIMKLDYIPVISIEKGGTGATTAEGARDNLNVPPKDHATTSNDYGLSTDTKYGHSKASTTYPKDPALSSSVGTEASTFARGDHTHKGQLVYSNVKVGSTNIYSSTLNDTITFIAGDNVTLTPNTTNKSVNVSSSYVDSYPTTFIWTNGSTYGPTGSLSGNNSMSPVTFSAIPSASVTTSGIVTTGEQSFKGNKIFKDVVFVDTGISPSTKNNGYLGTTELPFTDTYTKKITINADANSPKIYIDGTNSLTPTIYPAANDTGTLGTQSYNWSNIYTTEVTVASILTSNGSLSVAGDSQLNKTTIGTAENNKTLSVYGNINAYKSVTVSEVLNVTGNTNINGQLTTTGTILANGGVIGDVVGNASTATTASKVSNSLTLKINSGINDDVDRYIFNGSATKSLDIKAGNNVTLTPTQGILTISSTNTDTKYTAGTGLTITNANVINHTNSTTAGTYRSVTVDNVGHVTSGTNPTTLAGYGITDAYTKTEIDTNKADKATTLSGYGITDAKIETESSDDVKKITLGSNNVRVGLNISGKLTVNNRTMNLQSKLSSENAGSNMSIGIESNVLKFNAVDTKYTAGTGLTITDENVINHSTSTTAGIYKSVTVDAQGHVTAGSNPTTLSEYGITDAKISSGTITLGSNTMTPLTSSEKDVASGVAGLDSRSKVLISKLPITISSTAPTSTDGIDGDIWIKIETV